MMRQETFTKLVIYILIFGLQVAIGFWFHRLEHSSASGGRTFHIGDPDAPVTLRTCEPGEVAPDCVWSMQHSSTGGGGTFVSDPDVRIRVCDEVASGCVSVTSPGSRTSGIIDLAPVYNTVRDCDGRVWERTSVGWVSWSKDGSNAHDLRSDRPECGPQQERR